MGRISILVAYASRFGSTGEIAVAIADALRDEGSDVDVRGVGEVHSLGGYDAVVVGSCVNRGHWLPEGVEFLRIQQEDLSRVPVAVFTVHISNPPPAAREAFLDGVRSFVNPVAIGFFHGRFDRRGAALLVPRPLSWLVPPIDLRSWKRIRAWAEETAVALGARRASA